MSFSDIVCTIIQYTFVVSFNIFTNGTLHPHIHTCSLCVCVFASVSVYLCLWSPFRQIFLLTASQPVSLQFLSHTRDKSGRFHNEIPSSSWSCPPPTPRQLQCGCRWLPPRGRDTHRMLISALWSRNARQRREYFLSRSAPTVRVRVFSGALSRLVWPPLGLSNFIFFTVRPVLDTYKYR